MADCKTTDCTPQPRRRGARTFALAPALTIALALAASRVAPAATASAQGCQMCKETAYGQVDAEKNHRTARAFYISILTMLGVPAVLLGGLATLIWVNNRARHRQQ